VQSRLHSARRRARGESRFRPGLLFDCQHIFGAGSAIHSIEEINRPGVRIVAIANTTTARGARRTAPDASLEEVPSVDVMTEMAATG
jgi:polar amino acid transport system substrate-binding protein